MTSDSRVAPLFARGGRTCKLYKCAACTYPVLYYMSYKSSSNYSRACTLKGARFFTHPRPHMWNKDRMQMFDSAKQPLM